MAASSYGANYNVFGDGWSTETEWNPGGVKGYTGIPASFPDGLSNTVFVGERSSNLADSVWPGAVPFSTHFAWPPFASIGSGGIGRPYDGPGAFVGAHGGPCPYEDPVVIHPPNSPLGHSDQMQSGHPGGANILLGDGSVRFYSDDHVLSTWAALISRNGGEVIGEDY